MSPKSFFRFALATGLTVLAVLAARCARTHAHTPTGPGHATVLSSDYEYLNRRETFSDAVRVSG